MNTPYLSCVRLPQPILSRRNRVAIDDIVTFSSVDDIEQDPPTSTPTEDDVIWLGDGEGGVLDPSFIITSVVDNGAFNFTLITTQLTAGDYPVTDDLMVSDPPALALMLLADATGEPPSEEESTGWPQERPDSYDPDLYWDEETETWVTSRVTGPGAFADYVVFVGEEGEIYFGSV